VGGGGRCGGPGVAFTAEEAPSVGEPDAEDCQCLHHQQHQLRRHDAAHVDLTCGERDGNVGGVPARGPSARARGTPGTPAGEAAGAPRAAPAASGASGGMGASSKGHRAAVPALPGASSRVPSACRAINSPANYRPRTQGGEVLAVSPPVRPGQSLTGFHVDGVIGRLRGAHAVGCLAGVVAGVGSAPGLEDLEGSRG